MSDEGDVLPSSASITCINVRITIYIFPSQYFTVTFVQVSEASSDEIADPRVGPECNSVFLMKKEVCVNERLSGGSYQEDNYLLLLIIHLLFASSIFSLLVCVFPRKKVGEIKNF